jgi:hypothetical protein
MGLCRMEFGDGIDSKVSLANQIEMLRTSSLLRVRCLISICTVCPSFLSVTIPPIASLNPCLNLKEPFSKRHQEKRHRKKSLQSTAQSMVSYADALRRIQPGGTPLHQLKNWGCDMLGAQIHKNKKEIKNQRWETGTPQPHSQKKRRRNATLSLRMLEKLDRARVVHVLSGLSRRLSRGALGRRRAAASGMR